MMQEIESRFIGKVSDWSDQVVLWAIRAALVRRDRETLGRVLQETFDVARADLAAAGMDASIVETHLERLAEKACAR